MKKFILAALVAVVSVSANAQVWVGGEVGFTTSKTTVFGDEVAKASNVKVLPEIGYTLNDNWDIATTIGYQHAENTDILGFDCEKANAFVLSPYARYTYAKVGSLKFFVDGGFTYANISEKAVEDKANLWNIGIRPGLAYSLSPKTTIVAHVGDLSYSFVKMGDVKTNAFNLGVTNAITFGVYFGL